MNEEPLSVLVVEDEHIVAMDLQQSLQELGYDAYATAATADDAMRQADRRRPDIVLMDIRIKGAADGIEAAARLRERHGVPVVFLTAHSDPATLMRAARTEAYGYLLKPVKLGELRTTIEVACYRSRAERARRERERWLVTVLDCLGEAVLATTPQGHISLINPAACALLGVSQRAAYDVPVDELLPLLRTDETPMPESPVRAALREGKPQRHAELLLRTLEADRFVRLGVALVQEKETLLGTVIVMNDVTEERRVREAATLQDRLIALGTVTAGVAHEVNNPLAVASFFAELIAQDLRQLRAQLPLNMERSKVLDHLAERQRALTDALRRIGAIVEDLQAYTHTPTAGDDTASVREAVAWAVRSTDRLVRHHAALSTRLPALPRVRFNEPRLGQVLVNLLVNAAHAMPPRTRGHIEVEGELLEDGRVAIHVRDNGVGIPAAIQHRIFEPFFTTKGPTKGTGLGLAVVHSLVVGYGGELNVKSAEGEGTVFTLVLQREQAHEPQVRATSLNLGSARARVLIADDEADIRALLEDILEEHDVVSVSDGAELIQLLASDDHFDVLLCDLNMERFGAMEVLRELEQKRPDLADGLLILTGGPRSPEQAQFLARHPDRILRKPFSVAALREAIAKRLRSKTEGIN